MSEKYNGKPLISVALATYNGARFLREQLDSIYAQTYQNIEVVVCDDCSTDGTVEILEEYRKRLGLQYLVNDRNLGFVGNFGKVMSICRGEFIALADQDDIWLPGKLEALLDGLGEATLVYSDAFLIDDNGHELPGSLIRTSGVKPMDGRHFEYFVCNTCITGCTVMFRRDLLAAALPIPSCETYHDWWLAVLASRRNGVKYLDEMLVKYRQHESNDTGASVKHALLKRLAAHMRGESDAAKKNYYGLLLNRSRVYPELHERLELNAEEMKFLSDLGRYAESLLDSRFHPESFYLALRYRNILFPAAGRLERIIFVFSKLINKFFART